MKREIYYIVGIKDENIPAFRNTIINKEFCAKIIKITEKATFFELKGSEAAVIISVDWIEYLAPYDISWEL